MAGLTAARRLAQSGLKLQVFEGSDRLGGRMKTRSGRIELGAQWFHGTKNNPVYDFAVAKGLMVGAETLIDLQQKMWERSLSIKEGGTEYNDEFFVDVSTKFDKFV